MRGRKLVDSACWIFLLDSRTYRSWGLPGLWKDLSIFVLRSSLASYGKRLCSELPLRFSLSPLTTTLLGSTNIPTSSCGICFALHLSSPPFSSGSLPILSRLPLLRSAWDTIIDISWDTASKSFSRILFLTSLCCYINRLPLLMAIILEFELLRLAIRRDIFLAGILFSLVFCLRRYSI